MNTTNEGYSKNKACFFFLQKNRVFIIILQNVFPINNYKNIFQLSHWNIDTFLILSDRSSSMDFIKFARMEAVYIV